MSTRSVTVLDYTHNAAHVSEADTFVRLDVEVGGRVYNLEFRPRRAMTLAYALLDAAREIEKENRRPT